MAKIVTLSPEDEKEYAKWLASRPTKIKKMVAKHPQGFLYLLLPTNQRVFIVNYAEDGTVTVNVTREFNLVDFDRSVFGVNPDDLFECDLPRPEELIGNLI